eukprot:CAMPEP_0184478532 /NCGR_PEP_ID=MMETSP0113_2-20130426/534_1 /TAXON_ID=91329 /ORGANISM="Norrisiella sphaerica, Strain BC52" /LENGTH=275 /DNA_ID=CAMNT_0026856359 /DNA_START=455 /DNA_END=1279 /DNA_ORIENTATION=-
MYEYADACRVVSLIFLVFQIIAIIDYAYTLHFWMIDKEDVSYDVANLAASGVMFSVALTVIGFLFHWFAAGDECGLEKFVLSMTVIGPFIFTLISYFVPHGALFPSAAVTAYTTYIAYTAMLSSTNKSCNAFIEHVDTGSNWELAIGILLAAASITFTTWNVGSSSSKLFGGRGEGDDEKEEMLNPRVSDRKRRPRSHPEDEFELVSEEEDEDVEVPDEVASRHKFDAMIFHVLMTIASMYSCMLLTSWSTDDYSSSENRYSSSESFWVKVCSQW